MRFLLVVTLLFAGSYSYSQDIKVIDLQKLREEAIVKVHKAELLSEEILGLPKKLIIYNVFFEKAKEKGLITIALLPSFSEKEIQYDSIYNKDQEGITSRKLINEWSLRLKKTGELLSTGYRPEDWDYETHYVKSDSFIIYERINGEIYRVSSPVLIEFYSIKNIPAPFNLGENYATINLSSKLYPYSDFQNELKDYTIRAAAFENAGKFFLDHIENTGKLKYFFWSIPPMVLPQNQFHQGVGKFAFSEDQGVIEGEFRFYFDSFIVEYLEQKGLDKKEVKLLLENINYRFVLEK